MWLFCAGESVVSQTQDSMDLPIQAGTGALQNHSLGPWALELAHFRL